MADERRGQRPERDSDGDSRSSSNRGGTGASRGDGGRGSSGSKPPARGGKPAYGKRDDKPGYRGSRDDRPASGGRDSRASGRGDKPAYGKRDDKPGTAGRDGKPSYRAGDGRTAGGRPSGGRSGGPSGGRSGDRDKRPYSRERKDDRGEARPRRSMTEAERTAEQERYDGPPLPEEITGKELDRNVTAQLKGLPEKLAARVARHLAAAGMLIDSDPETAYKHTLAARARATRLAVVREATGEAAYAAGHYAEALSELRAAKRMNGAPDYLPIMADCHRALGQPEQAIKLAKSPSVANFSAEAKAEMTIVESGARRDMGQLDAALRTLELAPLMSKNREGWVVRLRYAYADILESAGRDEEALMWFHRTHAVDSEEMTDAAERAELLERKTR